MITAETRDYAALDRAVEEIGKFPFPQRNQLERIATKLRYLGLTTPEDRLCDEAQGGLGYILDDIADEIEAIREDLQEECGARLAEVASTPEAGS
jgi:hypothetical protein